MSMMLSPSHAGQSSYTNPSFSPTSGSKHSSNQSLASDDLGDDVGAHNEDGDDCVTPPGEACEGGEREGRDMEETLERLGFGAYHWRLLALCGFGWMSDNISLQCIAVILPRVRLHYNLSSQTVSLMSASAMAGMMIGAVAWGVVSDLVGRVLPFNSTLFLTAAFGIMASFAPSFGTMCICMFFLGTAVGGSMPTDGTLFLENLPRSKQYLLTLLSIFFSLGAILSSAVAYIFLPGQSCHVWEGCDIGAGANDGWKRVLLVLGLINMACALTRWTLLRLHESPRYLVSSGRYMEAMEALREIAKFNDVDNQCAQLDYNVVPEHKPTRDRNDTVIPLPHHRSNGGEDSLIARISEIDQQSPRWTQEVSPRPGFSEDTGSASGNSRMGYNAVESELGRPPRKHRIRRSSSSHAVTEPYLEAAEHASDESLVKTGRSEDGEYGYMETSSYTCKGILSRRRSMFGATETATGWVKGWRLQIAKLIVPKWRRTVILMWTIWGSMAFAYNMFNVWLPAVLESRAKGDGDEALIEALRDFVLFSLAGCPGSILGAWMIQTPLGRRKSLAIVTTLTAFSTFAFILFKSAWAVTLSSMTISMAATAMYAVLYGMTPESFGTSIRGTACGTSAAISRFTSIFAPVTAGFLLNLSPSLPVYVAAGVLVGTAACSLALPFERVVDAGGNGDEVLVQ